MRDVYECNLVQVPASQGYLPGNDNGANSMNYRTSEMIYKGYGFYKSDLPKIMVQRTASPFWVREIKTGLKIPLLYAVDDDIKKENYMRSPFRAVHTFIIILKENNKYWGWITKGLEKVTESRELEKYLAQDTEEFTRFLFDYFNAGYEKMQNKLSAEKVERERKKTERKAIKKLVYWARGNGSSKTSGSTYTRKR